MSALEKHYDVPLISDLWDLSQETVRKLFKDEPGVVRIGAPETVRRRKRSYFTLRVPESVLQRVHAKLSAKAAR